LTDDDGALAEIEDIDQVGIGWFRTVHLEPKNAALPQFSKNIRADAFLSAI
jgi:hypothetical protein